MDDQTALALGAEYKRRLKSFTRDDLQQIITEMQPHVVTTIRSNSDQDVANTLAVLGVVRKGMTKMPLLDQAHVSDLLLSLTTMCDLILLAHQQGEQA